MGKLTKVLNPSYVKDFQCIGSQCEDSCCIGWDIDIDKLTFREYFRTKNQQMKKEFSKYVFRNEYCDSEEVNYGLIPIGKSKRCPFLDEDNLCRIYKKLGENSLSNVCYSHPRVYNVLNGILELSLDLSCPEAVRKLLSTRDPIQFEEQEISLEKYIIHNRIDTHEKRWKGSPIRRLKELRWMSIETIQDRNFSISDRLLQLEYKLEKFGFSEPSRMNHRNAPIKVTDPYSFQLAFFQKAIKSLKVFTEIDSSVFIDCTRSVIKGLKLQENRSLKEKGQIYTKSITDIVEPFIDKNAYLFENYLVNFMFQGNFPFTENQYIFDGYLMMIVRYSFIRFYLTGIAAVKGQITKKDVSTLIQVHTKAVDHHDSFITNLLQEIKERNFDNRDFVRLLLK